MVKPILQDGDKTLRLISKEIKLSSLTTEDFTALKTDLLDTLRSYEYGMAIAAIQIGTPLRVFLIEKKDSSKPEYFINPKIVWTSESDSKHYESCLSVDAAATFGEVLRPSALRLEYIDEKGKSQSKKFDGQKARIISHEMDHLNGKLFMDEVDKSSIKDLEEYLADIKKTKAIPA